MSQPQSLSDCGAALCQCLVWKAQTEQDNCRIRLRADAGVVRVVMAKRAGGIWIIKRNHLLEVRSGWGKPADKHQVSTGGQVAQNEPGGVIALTAQTQ